MKEAPVPEHIALLDPEIESDDIDISKQRAHSRKHPVSSQIYFRCIGLSQERLQPIYECMLMSYYWVSKRA